MPIKVILFQKYMFKNLIICMYKRKLLYAAEEIRIIMYDE